LWTRYNKRTNGSRLKDGSYRVRIIQTTELGNPYVSLLGGKEFARTTYGTDGRGYLKKRKPAGNRQDRG
jgi:hypothetical protein